MKKGMERQRNRLLVSLEELLEGPMIFLGFAWLVLLIVELIWGLPSMLEYLSIAIWIIFILDFVLKFSLAPAKWPYLRKNMLTAISLFVPALRVFRLFRMLRILRFTRGIRLIRVVSSLNRTMKGLAATLKRRAFGYVTLLTLIVTFAGAAAMYAIEKPAEGFENYGMALWWTAMRVITAGSEYSPVTPEGRMLAFLLALFGYAIFGYVTAMLASFFIGRDAEETNAPVAGSNDIKQLNKKLAELTLAIHQLQQKQ